MTRSAKDPSACVPQMKILAPSEAACVYCRLGWLNVYNPCKPEGAWELDMSRREERVLAKTLCVLATNEPGDNWVFQTFRWMRSMESMPGWELVRAYPPPLNYVTAPLTLTPRQHHVLCNWLQTQPWLTEEGMPMRGLVNITYYSGEGVHKKGCRPYVNFRKALLNLVRDYRRCFVSLLNIGACCWAERFLLCHWTVLLR